MTAHFKNKVNYYEVWNEWDSSLGGTSPGNNADYQKLVRSVYPIIKKNNPNSTVITSAFSSAAFDKHLGIGNDDSMRTYLDSGIEDYTDAFAIHPYTTYKPKPHNKYETYVNDLKYSVSLVTQNKNLMVNHYILRRLDGVQWQERRMALPLKYNAKTSYKQ